MSIQEDQIDQVCKNVNKKNNIHTIKDPQTVCAKMEEGVVNCVKPEEKCNCPEVMHWKYCENQRCHQ